MKYGKFLSFLGGTIAVVLVVIQLFEGQNEMASVWGTVSIWAFANFFTELNLSRKEKQIQSIKDAIVSSKDEVEAINKINELL